MFQEPAFELFVALGHPRRLELVGSDGNGDQVPKKGGRGQGHAAD